MFKLRFKSTTFGQKCADPSFGINFYILTNSSGLVKYGNSVFIFHQKSTQKLRFWLKFEVPHFAWNFLFCEMQGWLIWNFAINFLNYIQKYPWNTFLVPNLKFFLFTWNFPFRQTRGYWIKLWQIFFQIPSQKISNKIFLVPNMFYFWELITLNGAPQNLENFIQKACFLRNE